VTPIKAVLSSSSSQFVDPVAADPIVSLSRCGPSFVQGHEVWGCKRENVPKIESAVNQDRQEDLPISWRPGMLNEVLRTDRFQPERGQKRNRGTLDRAEYGMYEMAGF
jgi:hypothetical protein